MTHHDIVKKLIGNIKPVGETNADNQSFENLQIMCRLVENLLMDIDDVSYKYSDRREYSVKRSADFAKDFLKKYIK